MKIKLLASDYDGTFHRHDDEDMKNNLTAVKNWRKNGNVFAFSTGRDMGNMIYEKNKNRIQSDYVVALNGALVVDKDNNIIFKATIPNKLAEELVDLMKARVGDEIMVQGGFDGCNQTNRKLEGAKAEERRERNKKIYKQSLRDALKNEIVSLGCLNENFEDAKALQKEISEKYGSEVEAFINLNYINIIPKGISKASGIAVVAKHSGVEVENIYVVGDDLNDIPMFERYKGYAVSNSKKEVKEKSIKVCSSVSLLIKDYLRDL